MINYIIRRLLLVIPTLLIVTALLFGAMRMVPGSILDLMADQMAFNSPAGGMQVDWIKKQLGLDVPVPQQYGRWLGVVPNAEGEFSGILQGNLGSSLWTNRPVTQEIRQRLPVSFELGLLALIISLLLALPIGIYSAIRQDTLGDYGARSFALFLISIPGFWTATLVIVLPSIWWNWMPPLSVVPIVEDPLTNLGQFIVPAFILGWNFSGSIMRMVRTMMLEVLRQDYIRTAWAKGLSERQVIIKHALKNSLIPVVTLVGARIPALLIGGAVIMENIFALPGMGNLFLKSLQQRDYPVISAVNLLVATFSLLIILAVDLTYGWLDPRVTYK